MASSHNRILTVFAPAKINLYLHVTGRRDDGYHTLDSLVVFADIGDQIEIEAAQDFEFDVRGSFSGGFGAKERDASPHSANLVVQAAWAMAHAAQKIPNVRATLAKNLPLSAGIGGGSSDAAALIWGLLEWWGISPNAPYLPDLMARLGADVPVCLPCQPAIMRGIGEALSPAPQMAEVPIVLVNPSKPCPTAQVFQRYGQRFTDEITDMPENLESFDALISFLSNTGNDLYNAAREIVPEIDNALSALNAQDGCALARLSGSGATCFGLFAHEHEAKRAAEKIALENPDWWVKSGYINRPERY